MGYKKKGTHMKKGSGFKMGGMHFGNQDPRMTQQGPLMKAGSPNDYDEMKDSSQTSSDKKRNKLTISSKLKDEGVNEAGHRVRTKTGINLFGQKRNVKKYFDPETNEYLGKEVRVDTKDGSKMYGAGLFQGPKGKQDVKIKTPNPGFTESGGWAGKFRQKKGYFDKTGETVDKKATTDVKKPGRVEFAGSKPELKEFVKKDEGGKESLASYKEAWDDGRFTVKDGKFREEIKGVLVWFG